MPETHRPSMSGSVAVVAAPAEIDVTTADRLRVALLRAEGQPQTLVVADLTRTLFSDSARRHHLAPFCQRRAGRLGPAGLSRAELMTQNLLSASIKAAEPGPATRELAR